MSNYTLPFPTTAHDIDQVAEQLFAAIPQVDAIYRTTYQDAFTYWITTTEQSYDRALIDQLSTLEGKILDQYPAIAISFQYIPLGFGASPDELIGASKLTIFQR